MFCASAISVWQKASRNQRNTVPVTLQLLSNKLTNLGIAVGNVFLPAISGGATLLGGATEVGDNVVIGGNAFLTESVESDTKVSIKKPEMTFRVKGGRF